MISDFLLTSTWLASSEQAYILRLFFHFLKKKQAKTYVDPRGLKMNYIALRELSMYIKCTNVQCTLKERETRQEQQGSYS